MSLKLLKPTLFPMGKDITIKEYMKLNIAFPFKGKIINILVNNIDHFEACGNYTFAIMDTGVRHLLDTNIGDTSLGLPGNFFDQNHKSFITNLDKVLGLDNGIAPYLFTIMGVPMNISRLEKLRIMDIMSRFVHNKGVRRSRIREIVKKIKIIKPLVKDIKKPKK